MAYTKKQSVLQTPTAKATTVLEDTDAVLPLPNMPQGVMALGPRVTFNFITSGYNQGNSYNYYDVVNIDGTSYISIQDVPANTPITNTAYWVKWNDPNAQFALLQNTVQEFDGRLTATNERLTATETEVEQNTEAINELDTIVNDGIYLNLGDSWVAGGEIAGIIAARKNLRLVNKAVSGASFTAFSGYVKTIEEEVNEAVSTISDPNLVKLITLVASVNDVSHHDEIDQNTLNTAAGTALSLIKTKFPNAEIIFAADAPYSTDFLSLSYYYYSVLQMQRIAYYQGVTFVNLFGMFNNVNYYKSDNLHPNTAGYGFVASSLLGGSEQGMVNINEGSNGDVLNLSIHEGMVYLTYIFNSGSARSITLSRKFAFKTIIINNRIGDAVTLTNEGECYGSFVDTINIPQSSNKLYGFIIGTICDY